VYTFLVVAALSMHFYSDSLRKKAQNEMALTFEKLGACFPDALSP
jgi:hypothetical protein